MVNKINCLIVDDEPTARDILEQHMQKIEIVELVASCKSAIEALAFIQSQKIDLVFLDINMPEISGLSFAKTINKQIKVIFTTAYREYAVDGFDLQAVDYLLKPISLERLIQGINKFMEENIPLLQNNSKEVIAEKNNFIFVRSDRKMIKVDFDAICYVESYSDYIKIHQKEKTIITRETISSIEVKLSKLDFLRVHRSFIIAISKIESFTNEYILINNKMIPISRSYRKNVLDRLANW